MAEQASALVSFRTYPHVDMDETGARAARCLHDLLGRDRPSHALEAIDFLIPLTSQSTLVEPMKGRLLINLARALSPDGFLFLGEQETAAGLSDAFEPVAGRPGLYARNPAYRVAA